MVVIAKRAIPFVALFGLSACLETDASAPEFGGMSSAEEMRCIGQGGMITGGLAGPACALPTVDAGKTCTRESECSSFCLAGDTPGQGQCAPMSPYFGCFDVLTNSGDPAVLCVD